MLTLLLALSAPAHEVVVFGDSWAEGGGDELGDMLADHGRPDLTVDNHGVGGTTAEYWNTSSPDALADAVTANPDARWVWLSILGNDTFASHASWNGATSAARNEAELREMLDRLYAVHPDILVVMFAYDWVNFEQSLECIAIAYTYFPDLVATGQFTTWNINQVFMTEIGEVQQRVAADYPGVTFVPIWGTLQIAGNTPFAPNQLFPSPASYMSDCIHPTSQGYRTVHEKLWGGYWGKAAPSAGISGPTEVCDDGSPITFTSTSSPVEARWWWVDGVAAGNDAAITGPLSPGVHTIDHRARNGAWTADATRTVTVSVRPDLGFDDESLSVCEGAVVELRAATEATWSPSTGLSAATGASVLASPLETTTYTATAGDPGCTAAATVEVVVLPVPTVGLVGPEAATVGEATVYQASAPEGAALTWTVIGGAWEEVEGGIAVTWTEAGPTEVAVTVSDGTCASVSSMGVQVMAPMIDDTPDAADGTDGTPGCGCATRGTGGWGALALLPLVLRRRRAQVADRRTDR